MRNQVFVAARDAVYSDEEIILHNHFSNACRVGNYIIGAMWIPGFIFCMVLDIMTGAPLWIYLVSVAVFSLIVVTMFGFELLGNFLSRRFPVRVSETGITGFLDLAATKMTWAEIEEVEPGLRHFMPALKVRSFRKDRPVRYLSLNVRSPEEFRAAVAHHASPNNPLRRYLEDEWEPGRERLAA